MSFYDFINRILGISGRRHGSLPPPRDDGPNGPHSDEFRNPIWNMDDDDDDDDDFRTRPPNRPFGFKIFSDPLEIHKFFEHQMEEFMRNFSMLDIPGMMDEMPPSIEPPPDPQHKTSLRDRFLKPGYERASTWSSGRKKQDQDLDDRISAGELDKILGEKPSLESDNTRQDLYPTIPNTKIGVFGKSVTSKTIHRPDGTVETHRTVKDSQGNEETTITRQRGDQSYTVTIHTDANGVKQRIENYNNLREEDLADFKKNLFDQRQSTKDPFGSNDHSWFLFNFRR